MKPSSFYKNAKYIVKINHRFLIRFNKIQRKLSKFTNDQNNKNNNRFKIIFRNKKCCFNLINSPKNNIKSQNFNSQTQQACHMLLISSQKMDMISKVLCINKHFQEDIKCNSNTNNNIIKVILNREQEDKIMLIIPVWCNNLYNNRQ